MAIELDATVGGESSNSYITVETADALLEQRFDIGTEWSALTEDEKKAALITATNRLEQEMYDAWVVTKTQALKFPRYPLHKSDGWNFYSKTEIPLNVQKACAELALCIVRDSSIFDDTGLENFGTFSKGDFSVNTRGLSAGKLPSQVARFLRGIRIGGDGTAMKMRG